MMSEAFSATMILGLDLSGVVAAGDDVQSVAVGDAVAAMADLNGDGGWRPGGAEAKAATPWRANSSPSASRHP
jgi:NADPH:quinone reductase-like Zn-dependent oxidoreductase